MKTLIKVSILLGIVALSLSSCSVYIPNGVNAPMFSRKGQAQLVASSGSGINMQGAYAISDHLGILANGYFINNTTKSDNDDDIRKGKGNLVEAGVGYFTNINEHLIFETYAGAGLGNVSIDRNIISTKLNVNFETSATKIFIQPTFGYVAKNFEIGFTPRLSMINYKTPTTTYTATQLSADKFVAIDKTTWTFIEPTITIRGGGEKLKGQLQIGKSLKLNKEELGYSSGIFNIGIIYRFN